MQTRFLMASVKDRMLAVKELLLARPGITHAQIVAETKLAPNTVTKYLRIIRAEWEAPANKGEAE